MDFVQQLLGAGGAGHVAARTGHLGDLDAAVLADHGEREAQPRQAWYVLDAGVGEVAAAHLAGAFEQVPGQRALAQALPVVHRPAEGVDGRREHQRRVGDTAGDDDVGALRQRVDQRLRAQIGIGRQQPAAQCRHRFARVVEVVALAQLLEDVVARDGGDLQVAKAERDGDLSGFGGRRERIRGAHVRDDLDAPVGTGLQHCQHARFEQRVVTERRILHPGLLGQGDGAFGQAFEHEVIEVAMLGQFERRFDAVARIAGAAADA